MEFRRLDLEDIHALNECRILALSQDTIQFGSTLDEHIERGPNSYAHILEHTGNDKAIFGAVTHAGEVKAMIGVVFETSTRAKHKAVIWGMYVDPFYRNQGIGGKLLDLALEFARTKPNAIVSLTVTDGNENAIGLYESRGFECWGVEPGAIRVDGVDYDEHHMSLVTLAH